MFRSRQLSWWSWLLCCALLVACHGTKQQPSAKQPKDDLPADVTLVSIEKTVTDPTLQAFALGFKLYNPSSKPITLQRMTFTVELDGLRLLSGEADELPTLKPQQQTALVVQVRVPVTDSLRLFNELSALSRQQVPYRLHVRLRQAKRWRTVYIEHDGAVVIVP